MKITLLVLNNFTNDARVHKEATTLASAGHQVSVIALWQSGLQEWEEQAGYRVIRMRLRSRPWRGKIIAPLVKYLEFAWRVLRYARREPAQVYHANDANTLPAAWLAARSAKAAMLYDSHELETGRNFGSSQLAGLYRIMWAWPERLFIHKASAVMSASPSYAEEIARLYHITKPRVILNCPVWKPSPSSDRLHSELGIPASQKVILYQGRVAAGRGIENFLTAVQQVQGTAGVVLGDGPSLEALRQRVQLGKWQRVYLPGKVSLSDLPDYTASADIGMVLIQPTCQSYRLSLPNKLFEYLHAGLAVVGSDLPEIGRVIREHQVGEVTDPDDIEAIAASLHRLLDDPDRLERAKANALQAATHFTWQQESQRLLEIYLSLESSSREDQHD
jgi:glycosyltransferase involved in cell wall biosynthesis